MTSKLLLLLLMAAVFIYVGVKLYNSDFYNNRDQEDKDKEGGENENQ